jgi:tripartite-type tricarboxylate transporter receptor subunit TctC
MSTVSRLSACLAIGLLAISDQCAWPQTISTFKIVVPVAPPGANDFLARVLAEPIGRAQGLAFTIGNRTGTGGIIGAEAVSGSAPDGSTLLMDSYSLLIDALVWKTNYDPLTSFEPICNLVDTPSLITVNAAAPYRKLADLIDAARVKPREITLPTVGSGGLPNWLREAQAHSHNSPGGSRPPCRRSTQKLVAQLLSPVGVCTTGFGSYLRTKYDEYGRAIREANIKAE